MVSVVITGASRGLGLEFVRTLGSDPNNTVIGLYRSSKTADKLLALVEKNPNIHAVRADVANVDEIQAAVPKVSDIAGGKLDLLINNAAFNPEEPRFKPITEWIDKPKELEQYMITSFQVNAIGPTIVTNAFLPLLRNGTTKKILNLSSGIADPSFLHKIGMAPPVYAQSKAALNMATVGFALALKQEGFTVLSVSPGLVDTAEEPPTPEVMARLVPFVAGLKVYDSEWIGKPLDPETSVKLTLGVVNEATVDDSGAFLSQYGNHHWL